MASASPIVFIVDDEPSVTRSLKRLLLSHGLESETFASAEEFLSREPADRPSCLLLDVRMPDRDGLDLQRELERRGRTLQVVFLTGHATVPMGIEAMKGGAVDFLEKPFEDEQLLAAVREAIDRDARARRERAELDEVRRRRDALTPRQRQVFSLVVRGLLNKQIAAQLGKTEKTIKKHRGRVMATMQAGSFAELVRMAERLGEGSFDSW